MFSFISPRSTLLGVGLLALTSAAVTIPRLVRSRRAQSQAMKGAAAQKNAWGQKKSGGGSSKKQASRRKSKNARSQKHANA